MKAAKLKEPETTDRIVSRVPTSARSLLEKAAAVYGATINQFIVQAAVDRARTILNETEVLRLTENDAKVFMVALSNPPKPNTALMKAMRQHTQLVESAE